MSAAPMSPRIELPPSVKVCRERLLLLGDDMASLRTQIAIIDIRRQDARRALDVQWFEQTRASLQAKQREAGALKAHLKTLCANATKRGGREEFKDALIEVVRLRCKEADWAQLVSQARALHQEWQAAHG